MKNIQNPVSIEKIASFFEYCFFFPHIRKLSITRNDKLDYFLDANRFSRFSSLETVYLNDVELNEYQF